MTSENELRAGAHALADGPDLSGALSLEPWFARWSLEADGDPFVTPFGSRLAPVRHLGAPAMLKIAGGPEERDGGALMAWWAGDGAARVIARQGEALLMERAAGSATLATLVAEGRDDEATLLLCQVAARLHEPRAGAPPVTLKPLPLWFRALRPSADAEGGVLRQSLAAARDLLASPEPACVLHGDLHHDNVLDFGERGWLAIDPKGLIGERGFDYANLFCNPWPAAVDPGRFDRRLGLVADAAKLDPRRLRRWILAYAGLSAAWTLQSGMPADGPWRALRVAEIAASGV
jgi:streptomycin 6-kinase